MYYTITVWLGLIWIPGPRSVLLGLLGVNFALLSLSMPDMTPEYKSRLLTTATSKTLKTGAEEVRWLRLLLHQHSSAGTVMYGFRDLDQYSGACESQFRTVILRHDRRCIYDA